MTIRDYIRARARPFFALAFVAIALFVFAQLANIDPSFRRVLFFAALGIYLVAWYRLYATKCPRCNNRLNNIASQVGLSRGGRPVAKLCPYCGVSLDEPLESSRHA
jgi:hypothetical protein